MKFIEEGDVRRQFIGLSEFYLPMKMKICMNSEPLPEFCIKTDVSIYIGKLTALNTVTPTAF